jgi:anoctamin-10
MREHFGEHVALYFGFLNFYFQSLFSIAVVGTAFWAAGAPFHPIYSLILVSWSCIFVELWRMKERKFAVRWGTAGVSNVDARRNEFKPRYIRKDPATGEDEEVFEWWNRELRIACCIPVMVFFAALLVGVLTTMFVVEVFVSKLYVSGSLTEVAGLEPIF